MKIIHGLKDSIRISKATGIKPELIRKENNAGLILGLLGTLCLIMLIFASFVHAEEVDMRIIAQIESSGNAKSIGDNGQALGLYQLHKGVIMDYNRITRSDVKFGDRSDPAISKRVAVWYMETEIPRLLRYYGLKTDLNAKLTAWNMGVGAVKQGKRATGYINKYNRIKGAK